MNIIYEINTDKNALTIGDFNIKFSHRWESVFFYLLLSQARTNQALSAETLNIELKRRGQKSELTRTQQHRLVQRLISRLSSIPNCTLTLTYAPRNASVGPWQIKSSMPFDFRVIAKEVADQKASNFPHLDLLSRYEKTCPRILLEQNEAELRSVLSTCMISDSFAMSGNFLDAHETLQPIYKFNLSHDALAMFTISDAAYNRRAGNFKDARRLAMQVLDMDQASFVDNSLRQYAHFLLDRIDYDEAPGISHNRLWANHTCLDSRQCIDMHTHPEWHNLRALLIRRRMEDIRAEKNTFMEGEDFYHLHLQAMLHFEFAIYCALQHQKWERLQAYVANFALHLQTMIQFGLTSIAQTFAWHELTMTYEEKLEAGRDSAWQFIFLGEFWLDHEEELRDALFEQIKGKDKLTIIENLHPSNEKFYLRAIERLRCCGDHRQVAIAWICYGRFAKKAGNIVALQKVRQELGELFRNTPLLRENLQAEGYGCHLAQLS